MAEENGFVPENNENEEYELMEGDLIEMIDEAGNPVQFEFVHAMEFRGDIFLALTEPDGEDEVFFLKIEQDDDGQDVYSAADEELEDALFDQFLQEYNGTGEKDD